MIEVVNHKLTGDPNLVDLTHKPAPNRHLVLLPSKVIIHYDVCQDMAMNTGAQFASGLFYHVAIDGLDGDGRRPEVRQYVPFNRRGSHAKGQNDSAIGLVIVNPGPLIRGSDLRLRTTYGKEWPEDRAVEAKHWHPGAPKNWTHWATYTYEERDAVLEVLGALVETYPSIGLICGHEHTDPGRKFDPGPAAEDMIMAPIRGAFPHVHVPENPQVAA